MNSSNQRPLRIGQAARLRICNALNHEGAEIRLLLAPFGRFRVSLGLENNFVWATCALVQGRNRLSSGQVRVAPLGDWPALWAHLATVYANLSQLSRNLNG